MLLVKALELFNLCISEGKCWLCFCFVVMLRCGVFRSHAGKENKNHQLDESRWEIVGGVGFYEALLLTLSLTGGFPLFREHTSCFLRCVRKNKVPHCPHFIGSSHELDGS